MIDDRTRELIHAGIDGELDDAGRAELRQHLEASAEAREYHDQMQQLESFLDRVPAREPPAGMHTSIMGAIRLPRSQTARRAFRFAQFPGFVRYGLATAAGLLLAVGIYEYRPGTGPDSDLSGMTGTVLPGRSVAEDVRIDDARFELAELNSEVSLLRRGESLVLDMRVEAFEPIVITVEFQGDGLQFDAIAQMESDLDSIEISDRTIRIDASGQQHFAVVLHREAVNGADARVLMNWSTASKVLKTEEFSIN